MLADEVKAAISSGCASLSTVIALQNLLGLASATEAQQRETGRSATRRRPTSRTIKSGTSQPARKNSRKDNGLQIHEDEPPALTPRTRYVLATEIVNATLKVLSKTTRHVAQSQGKTSSKAQKPVTPQKPSGTPSTPQRALQLRAANSTPVPQSPAQTPKSTKKSSKCSGPPVAPPDVAAVAECARTAFSFLRSVDAKTCGVRELPKLELECGMLAFCGRLIALDLHSLAAKELRAIRRRLEAILPLVAKPRPTRTANENASGLEGSDSLAQLLRIEVDIASCPESWPLIITYHLHVLHLIFLSQRPVAAEDVIQYFAPDNPSVPVSLIIKHVRESKETGKVIKQLEALSQAILRLCPGVATSADELAQDRKRSPAPMAAFKLQTTSFQVRREIWKLEKIEVDLEADLAAPLAKCLSALLRRLPAGSITADLFRECKAACEILGISSQGESNSGASSCQIFRMLSILAEKASLFEEAYEMADAAVRCYDSSETTVARYVAVLARRTNVKLLLPETDTRKLGIGPDLNLLSSSLKNNLSGTAHDCEILLGELAQIARRGQGDQEFIVAQTKFACAAAGFASQYVHSVPGKSLEPAQELIRFALALCGSNEKLLSWVNTDTCQVLIQFGVLRTIAEKSATKSMNMVWSSFGAALALGRLLKIIVLRAAAMGLQECIDCLVDDEQNTSSECGALLEWQTKCLLDIAHKTKYRQTLQSLLPEVFWRLEKTYVATDFPLRRARVAALAFRTYEEFPGLLPADLLATFADSPVVDCDCLGRDEGLKAYAADIEASLNVSRAFFDACPSIEKLKPNLDSWQVLLGASRAPAAIEHVVDSPKVLAAQLRSLGGYLEMLGDDVALIFVLGLLQLLTQILDTKDEQLSCILKLARAHIALGYAETALRLLEHARQLRDDNTQSDIVDLDYHLTRAQCLLSIDNLDDCKIALQDALQGQQRMQPESLRSCQNVGYKLLHCQAWLLHSRYLFATGTSDSGLCAAKRAVKGMNSIWHSLERSEQITQPNVSKRETKSDTPSLENLITGVRKLDLKASNTTSNQKGASFWPAVRLLCTALMHLSDIFVYHGIFNEANYHSEHALKVAESVNSLELLSRARHHRIILLTAAGRVEEAELCLTRDDDIDAFKSPLTKIEYLKAKAALSVKIGDPDEAHDFFKEAEALAKLIQTRQHVELLEQKAYVENPTHKEPETEQKRGVSRAIGPKSSSCNVKTGRAKAKPATTPEIRRRAAASRQTVSSTQSPDIDTKTNSVSKSYYMLQKVEAALALEKAMVASKLGHLYSGTLEPVKTICGSVSGSFRQSYLLHDAIMKKVALALQADFSFNVLPESTLSFPALQDLQCNALEEAGKPVLEVSSIVRPTTRPSKSSKNTKRKGVSLESLDSLLLDARQMLKLDSSIQQSMSTYEMHQQQCMLSAVAMVMSATSVNATRSCLHPVSEALNVDYARMHATRCQQVVTRIERDSQNETEKLGWPELGGHEPPAIVTANSFRDDYIDILPSSWMAVSLGLNDACDELYLTRYRRSQPPLILRLPFSRQKSDDPEEEMFDFQLGKAEMNEIIELSNYSCHNSVDNSIKGAKTNWWAEREALDRRLQELLINIENIWLGGFKGVFSQHQRDSDQLGKFRKTFDAILDRHLPSRKTNKRGTEKMTLDDQILELFIGLQMDLDGDADLDEPISDLLYFVVDILQFSGERNAYDEIDFDSMAIEVLDALHGNVNVTTDGNDSRGEHLILVLDRRLQAFPWESLPCLERSSVSRVDSMLTLRERIVDMRQKHATQADDLRHVVSRAYGSYILNPSSDLKNTEATLAPELSKLASGEGHSWTSIVGREPSEEDFRTALSTSSTLLYYGHGAGSQYIRPRTIRRLDQCSEVVWLMGCSSGAATEYDELEPFAVPLAYLRAGSTTQQEQNHGGKCMAVLATLWDVTDRDIDRFSLSVGEEWGLWKISNETSKLPSKPTRTRERLAAPCTPEKATKTPKTPKVRKTPAPTRTPGKRRGELKGEGCGRRSLVEAVSKSRDACYLRYLNGAAPVVYGVPVFLGD